MVSPVLLKLHGSPEKVGSFHGNFCHVLLSFPLQLHFYKFLVPNLDQLMLWQISVGLDITRFVSLCPPDVCPSAEFSKQGDRRVGGSLSMALPPPLDFEILLSPHDFKNQRVCA